MARDNSPSSVKEILDRLLSQLGIDSKINQMKILNCWGDVVGEKIKKHSQPFAIRKGNLFVKVDSSTWLAQLSYFKEKIISDFNTRQGKEIIKDIYFRIGKIYPSSSKNKERRGLRRVKLTEEDIKWIDKTLKSVKDKHLRKILRRILIKDKRLKKSISDTTH